MTPGFQVRRADGTWLISERVADVEGSIGLLRGTTFRRERATVFESYNAAAEQCAQLDLVIEVQELAK